MVSFAYESCNVRSKTFSVFVCPWSIIIICGSAFSPKTFHRQPRRDPVNVEFVLFEFTDIPAVLAVDADKISSRFYYVVDGETHLG